MYSINTHSSQLKVNVCLSASIFCVTLNHHALKSNSFYLISLSTIFYKQKTFTCIHICVCFPALLKAFYCLRRARYIACCLLLYVSFFSLFSSLLFSAQLVSSFLRRQHLYLYPFTTLALFIQLFFHLLFSIFTLPLSCFALIIEMKNNVLAGVSLVHICLFFISIYVCIRISHPTN